MRLYVPEIGDSIWLDADWTFPLYDEHRNEGLLKIIKPDYKELRHMKDGGRDWRWYGKQAHACTLPAGTELICSRVYIRNGAADYSSLTFRIGHCSTKALRKKRFWVKLTDANKIEFVIAKGE